MATRKDIILLEARRQLLLKSYYEFFLYFWDEVSPEPLVDNFHIKILCNELQEIGERVMRREPKLYDLIINISPSSSKSTIASVLYPCWLWAKQPSLKILTGSYAQTLSVDLAVKSRNVIKSDKFRLLFPDIELKEDENNKSSYSNNHLGNRRATSVGSGILGFHASIHIIDDPTTATASRLELKKANEWISTTLSTRKIDKLITPLILIQQRIAIDDATAYLLSRGNPVKHICLPAELNDLTTPEYREYYQDGLFDPIRLSKEILQKTRIDIGSRGYSTQFLQSPVDIENSLIKKDWFNIIPYSTFKERTNSRMISGEYGSKIQAPPPIPHFIVDTATTEKKSGDATAILSYYFVDNIIYVFDVKTARLNPADLNNWIIKTALKNGYTSGSIIHIESAMTGVALISHLKQQGYRTSDLGKPHKDKIWRANQCLPEWEGGRVVLIDGSYINSFLEEIIGFPDTSPNDDQVDCLIYVTEKNLIKKRRYDTASV